MATIPNWFEGTVLIATLSLSVSTIAQEAKATGERAPAIEKVPAAVRATVTKETKGGQVGDILPALRNGTTVYFVQYVIDGARHTILLASDGSVIERQGERDFDD
jgi:hypothetical protein